MTAVSKRGIPLDKSYPTETLHFNGCGGLPKGTSMHPTQKPVALLEYLIKTYTIEGETVLDFTMGSGSTGVACKNLNRKFIGIEKDGGYFEIAQKRIAEIAPRG
jgi:site-specific DNA-methyltransferase (adenine-specific)